MGRGIILRLPGAAPFGAVNPVIEIQVVDQPRHTY